MFAYYNPSAKFKDKIHLLMPIVQYGHRMLPNLKFESKNKSQINYRDAYCVMVPKAWPRERNVSVPSDSYVWL